jgi:glycosyltransferase involved in cell wall biosynthesis
LKSPLVSIVVPALNEAQRLERTLPQLREYLSSWSAVETIIVDDGSIDGTAAVASRELAGVEHTVLRLPWHQGKGAALRAGVGAARGKAIVFMDADLAAGLDNLPRLLDGLRHADISVGSRHLAESQIEYDNKLRAVCSKWFGRYVRAVTHVDVSDTQCGFKAFRADPAKMLFHLAETSGFAMDVELLSLARLLGYSVAEVPISWADRAGSKVNLFHDPVKMAVDVLRLHLRLKRRSRALTERLPGDLEWIVRVAATAGPSFAEAGQNAIAAGAEPVLAPVTPLTAIARP